MEHPYSSESRLNDDQSGRSNDNNRPLHLRINHDNNSSSHHNNNPTISSTPSGGEVNLSRDESETGEEYFLPREAQQQHSHCHSTAILATTTITTPNASQFVLANLSLSPEYSPSATTAVSSSPPIPRNGASSLLELPLSSSSPSQLVIPRTSSQNSLVELLYGEEIMGSTTIHHHSSHTPQSNIIMTHSNHHPNLNNNSNNNNIEFASVSTNTVSSVIMEDHGNDYDRPTTPTTITPPSMAYPFTLSPPQLRQPQVEVDDGSDNENFETDMEPPSHATVAITTTTPTPTAGVASPSSVAVRNSYSATNNLPNHPTNRPPRAPQPSQYRPPAVTSATTSNSNQNNNNTNNNNNNHSSSSASHNSSSSAMSSVPMTTTPTTDRNPSAQHYRVVSTGDASILSALTADSADYHLEIMAGSAPTHLQQRRQQRKQAEGILLGMTTPDVYRNGSNIGSSCRSYVGLPTFRDSSLRGRGGTRSLSGTSATSRMNHLRQRRPSHAKADFDYSPTSSHQDSHITGNDDDDAHAAVMSGMDIDIPNCLQQPILGDNDSYSIINHRNHSNISNDPLTHEQQILPSNGEIDTSNIIDKVASPDISPLVFHSVDPNPSLDRTFLDMHQENEREERRIFHHHKAPKLSEYETEAETAILAAIDDEVKRESVKNNIRTAIFPTLSHDEEDVLRTEYAERAGILEDETSDDKSTAFSKWYALQQAEIGFQDSIMRQPKMSLRSEVSAMNSLTDNATTLFDKIQAKNAKRSSTSRTSKNNYSEKCNDTLHMSNLNATNESIEIARDGDDNDDAMDAAEQGDNRNPPTKIASAAMKLQHKTVESTQRIIEQRKADWIAFEEFILSQKETAFGYMKNLVSFCMLPSLLLACILYYVYGNPPTGRARESMDHTRASVSWWVIFIGIRHPLVWSVARGCEYVFSNFLGASSPRFMKLVGPRLGLILAHSKGWPCVLLIYGILSLQFLNGESKFVKHWLYWQNFFSIFTESNPAGDVTSREEYTRFLVMLIFVGITVSIKRVCLGYYFGQRICARYSDDLHELLEKLLLLSEIATLSFAPRRDHSELNISIDVASQQSVDQAGRKSENTLGNLDSSHHFQKVLEEWDEPIKTVSSENKVSSLKDILEFRQTVHLMQTDYPFSKLFGRADKREACVDSSTKVFKRLVDNQLGSANLQFDTLAKIVSPTATKVEASDYQKLKRLITLFRPNKDKELSMIDFIRSVDTVYRELRTLSASISNATAIDRVFEMILNFCFYLVLIFICFGIMGIGVLSFAVAFSSTILAVSFIIGSACSSLFEGLVMILARRPYDIGDRIALSNVDDDTDPTGSLGWIVEDIDIFYTTVRFGATREVATLSNGSIVRCRIINARRSDDAQLMIRMKFGIKTTSQQTHLFQSALEKFIEDRPQEYHNTLGFRLNTVVTDMGYIEYMIIVQCRSSWQKIGSVLDSRAKVTSFCLELQKQLDMRYVAPPMPIDLTMNKASGSSLGAGEVASSYFLPRHSIPERGSTLQRKVGSRRESDLVFSVESDHQVQVENTAAQLSGEGKKDI